MRERAIKRGVDPDKAPYFPQSFRDLLARADIARICESGAKLFQGKKVLVLSGGADELVPWSVSQRFVEDILDVGEDGVSKTIVYDGVGHECTDEMIDNAASFVVEYCM
jgi:predicted esterase